MSSPDRDDGQSAVLDAPVRPRTADTPTKPRRVPPYAVIVLNDDHHTFAYVIETFQKVLGYEVEKCFLLAKQIHEQGRAVVWTGPKEVAELKADQIRGMGPDFYAAKPVKWPLGVTIEPMP